MCKLFIHLFNRYTDHTKRVDESCIRGEFNSTVFVEIGTQDGGLKRAIYNIRLLLLPVVALQV